MYSVKAEILPPAGEQHCRSGLLCGLEVCITRLSEPAEGEMAEESKTDTDGLKTTKLMYEGMSREDFSTQCLNEPSTPRTPAVHIEFSGSHHK